MHMKFVRQNTKIYAWVQFFIYNTCKNKITIPFVKNYYSTWVREIYKLSKYHIHTIYMKYFLFDLEISLKTYIRSKRQKLN